jgi:hypothetical protein
MRAYQPPKSTNRFSAIDLAVDLFLLAWPLAFALGFDPAILMPANTGFLSASVDMLAIFLAYFGLALYVSRMYSAVAISNDEKRPHRILFPSLGLGAFSAIIVLTVIISGYIILTSRLLPPFSSILVVVQSILFGFSFGVNFEVERRRSEKRHHKTPADTAYDLSLSNFPYLLMTLLFIFPIEYFVSKSESALATKVLLVLLACIATIFIGNRLDKRFFQELRINAEMSSITAFVVALFMGLGLIGFGVLYAVGTSMPVPDSTPEGARLVGLILFGILPIRIGAIIFSRSNLFNKVSGIFAVAFFLLFEIGLIKL